MLLFAALPLSCFGQSQNLVTGSISSSGSSCQPGATYTNCVIAAIPSGATAPAQSVGVTITGTFSGTLQFEISLDNGANWSAVNATPPNSTSAVTSTTGTGFWAISAAAGSYVRVRASALASGSATASVNPSQAIVPSAGGGSGSGTRTLSQSFGTPGGSAISTGVLGYVRWPYVCSGLASWSITVDVGTATVKTWKIATGTAIPTTSNSISTSGVAISTGTNVTSTTVTDFTTTTTSADDVFGIDLSTVSGVGFIQFELVYTGCTQ